MSATGVQDVARLRVREGENDGIAIHGVDWPAFWGQLCSRLRQDGYRPNTLRVYRQILRDLRAFLRDRHGIARPGGLTAATARGFQESLCVKNVSWSWMAGDNIRAVQESLGHHSIKTALRYQDCLPPKAAGPADLFPDSCPLRCRSSAWPRHLTGSARLPPQSRHRPSHKVLETRTRRTKPSLPSSSHRRILSARGHSPAPWRRRRPELGFQFAFFGVNPHSRLR